MVARGEQEHAGDLERPLIRRKPSPGSEDGSETQAVLMSVFRTLEQRGHNSVSSVLEAVRTSLETGRRPPSPGHEQGDGAS
jgi:hypothetical protein